VSVITNKAEHYARCRRGRTMVRAKLSEYITKRVDDQLEYFETKTAENKRWYKTLKLTAIACNVLPTMAIALAFVVPAEYKVGVGILALVLSAIVPATYQLEELQNHGVKWEKFRLVAEQLKSEKFLFLNSAGPCASDNDELNQRLLTETVERIVGETALSYFLLMIEPGKRLEKRTQQVGREKESR
jgi:hypothetical protein